MIKDEYYPMRDADGFWTVYSERYGLLSTALKFEKLDDAKRYCDTANWEEEERLIPDVCHYDLGPSG